ncbi:hypothetical protein, partial [Acidiphilium sp.]|uniref:hypothetical protein n=1 Tax=Acidiphilium sp. TaxID=527 RepID=UPI003D08C007
PYEVWVSGGCAGTDQIKKNLLWFPGVSPVRTRLKRVFWFFFAKKNAFPSPPQHQRHGLRGAGCKITGGAALFVEDWSKAGHDRVDCRITSVIAPDSR